MKSLTLFLSALMMWGYSLSAAADPSCEGRFVNPITDVCWQCIFPMSIGSVSVAAGGGPDTVNPASPVQYCPAPPPIFVRIGLAIGSGIGGLPSIERNHEVLLESGPRRLSPCGS